MKKPMNIIFMAVIAIMIGLILAVPAISKLGFQAARAVSDAAYNASTWNGVIFVSPSKNAVRDKIETLCLESVFGDTLGTGLLLTSTTLSVSAILQEYHGVNPSAYILDLLDDADEATFKATVNLEAGTDFYGVAAADAAFEAELNNSAGLLAALSDETGTGVAVFGTAPTFTTSTTMGSAVLTEPEWEILDGATLSTTEINYLDGATGITGTGNTVRSISPTFTGTATFATINAASIVLDASATPGWVFRDSGNAGTDKEIAKQYANATTTTDGAEDGEVHIQVMDSGSEKTVLHADGDTGAEHVEVGPADCTYDMHTYYSINAVNDTWSGTAVIMTVDSGATSVYGQALHVDTDGELIVADGDVASSGAAPCIGLAIGAGTGAKLILLHGFMTETDWDWQLIGGPIYLSDDPTTTEGLTETAISTSADTVQILGIVMSADTIYFNPSLAMAVVP